MRKRNIVLIALIFALVVSATIQPAIAYFTTYVRAKGGYEVSIGDTTTIKESFSDWTKKVQIVSEKGSEPVFIRAKVQYTGKYPITVSGDGWTEKQSDGYYYYGDSATELTVLEETKETTELKVAVSGIPEKSDAPDADNTEFNQLKDGEGFSIVVVYESTPVRYNPDGTTYADWDAKVVKVNSTTGGNS